MAASHRSTQRLVLTEEIQVTVSSYGPGRKYLMMRYTDPITGKRHARSTGTASKREAERIAAKWEADLNAGRYSNRSKITWAEFRTRYEEEKLSSLAERTAEAAASSFNHVERVINPDRLVKLTSAALSRFQSELRKEGMKDTTIATHLRQLRAALGWAVSVGMLPEVPESHLPKRTKGRKLMRGRPITAEEFDRMIGVVPQVRPHDPGAWQRYLTGLWLSGLRLEESTILSWDDDAAFSIDLSGRRPRFRIYAEAEKGHQDRLLPMTPDFAEWILQVPEDERKGRVFRLERLDIEAPMSCKRVGRIVSKIGKKAGVVVNKAEGKYGSAHDLRRAFGTRWAPRVKPATLQLLMRHSAIETTLRYYVAQDSDDVADELWAGNWSGNTCGNTSPNAPPDSEKGASQETTKPLTE